MPVGYWIGVLFVAVCTGFALAPSRPRRSRPFSVAYWFGFVINEIPLIAIELVAASTLLALVQGDLSSPGGVAGAGLAAITVFALVALAVRGARSARRLRYDVAAMTGRVPA